MEWRIIFLKYKGNNIGNSIKENDCEIIINEIFEISKKYSCEIIYPKMFWLENY